MMPTFRVANLSFWSTVQCLMYVMSSLRVFSSRKKKKNCYKINFNGRERVLVRASFYYGDYDLKFSLQFLTFNLMAVIGPLSTLRTCMILFLMGQYILWKQTIIACVLLKQCLTKCHSYQHLSSGACFMACIAKLLLIMLCS